MAELIVFPAGVSRDKPFVERRSLGTSAGMTVRIVERLAWPHDMLVVLNGGPEGARTLAAVPAGEDALADLIGEAVMASLAAAESARDLQRSAS